MPYGKFYIYALIDPDTDEVFYIGRSIQPERRLKQHMSETDNRDVSVIDHVAKLIFGVDINQKLSGNQGKLERIQQIRNRGKSPVIRVIDEWECQSIKNANRLEDAWIAHYRALGHPLQNKILSRRMSPFFYSSARHGWKEGFARSPMEYISKLKAGEIGKKKSSSNDSESESRKPYKKRRRRRRRRRNRAMRRVTQRRKK